MRSEGNEENNGLANFGKCVKSFGKWAKRSLDGLKNVKSKDKIRKNSVHPYLESFVSSEGSIGYLS